MNTSQNTHPLNVTISVIPEGKELLLLQIGLSPFRTEHERTVDLALPAFVARTIYYLIVENNKRLHLLIAKEKTSEPLDQILELHKCISKGEEVVIEFLNKNRQLEKENRMLRDQLTESEKSIATLLTEKQVLQHILLSTQADFDLMDGEDIPFIVYRKLEDRMNSSKLF